MMDIWPFFGGKRSKINRTAFESVQIGILVAMEGLIKDAREYNVLQKTKQVIEPVKMSSEVKALISAGFTEHRKVVEYNRLVSLREDKVRQADEHEAELYQSVKALRILLAARQYYGDDTLFLPFNKFRELCDKYNLECAPFSKYKGDIPSDKLEEIITLKHLGRQLGDIIMLRPITSIKNGYWSLGDEEEAEVRKRFDKFPFVRQCDGFLGRNVVHADGTERRYNYVELQAGEQTPFFITAPTQMFDEKYVVVKNQDPFICSLTDSGVLIFTRWGEEADDEIICKSEDFNFQLKALRL